MHNLWCCFLCVLSLEIVHVLCYTVYSGKGAQLPGAPRDMEGDGDMPIKYDKLLKLLDEKGYTSYRIRKEKILGQATLTAIKNGTGGLDHRSIARLCQVLQCQPGEIMEYVPDAKAGQEIPNGD